MSDETDRPTRAERDAAAAPAVEMRGAAAARGGRTIWKDAAFALPRGSASVVLGPNGAGKTTLFDMELGLLAPAAGQVRVLGEAPGRAGGRVGYVPQNYLDDMDETVTVGQSVLLGLTGTRWGLHVTTKAEKARVAQALEFVGLAGRAGMRLSELSGGMRQRAALAQALVSAPELLLLDEPLANLDVTSQAAAVDLLGRLNRERGMTVQVISHDLTMLLPILDSAIYILEGRPRLCAIGDVLDAALLSRVYGTRIEIVRTGRGDVFIAPVPGRAVEKEVRP